MRFTRLAIFSAAATLIAGTAQAQTTISGATDCDGGTTGEAFAAATASCTRTTQVDVVVPYLAASKVTGVSSITITNANMNAGFREWTGPVVEMQANFNYAITAQMTPFGSTKADSDLLIKNTTESGAYAAFGGNAVTLKQGNATANYQFTSGLKVLLDWATDEPGTLSTTITYTVIAQ